MLVIMIHYPITHYYQPTNNSIDAVLSDKSGYSVADIKFLKDMNKYWFEEGILEV
jgi:hypothetical protein